MALFGGGPMTVLRGAWLWNRRCWDSRPRIMLRAFVGAYKGVSCGGGSFRKRTRRHYVLELPTEKAALQWSQRLSDCINSLEWGAQYMMKNGEPRKLFELLVLSGALAELSWLAILSKRHIFREVFMDFDPELVSKLNEKKLIAPGSIASSLLSEPKLRAIIENACQILKIIEEFGSFNRYCWSFVNQKPIISKFRYPHQVPVKTPKADVISKDLVRRDFRSVGPTVIYSFMQASGITHDHLIGCFRFGEFEAAVTLVDGDEGNAIMAGHDKMEENTKAGEKVANMDLDLFGAVDGLSISNNFYFYSYTSTM